MCKVASLGCKLDFEHSLPLLDFEYLDVAREHIILAIQIESLHRQTLSFMKLE